MKTSEIIDYFIEYEGHNIINSIRKIKSKLDLKNDELTNLTAVRKVILDQKYQKICSMIDFELKKLEKEEKKTIFRMVANLVYNKTNKSSEDIKKGIGDVLEIIYTYKAAHIEKQKEDIYELITRKEFLLMYPVYNFGSSIIPLCTYRCFLQSNRINIIEYAFTEELLLAVIGYDKDIDAYFGGKKDKEQFFRSINSYDNNSISHLTEIILEEIYNKIPESKIMLGLKQQQHFKVAIDGSVTGYIAPFKEELMLVKHNLKTKESALLNNYLSNKASREYKTSMSSTSHYGSYPFGIDYVKGMLPKYGVNEKQWSILDRSNDSNILAVTGPPGTGKTTVLKEVIADNLVKKTKDMIDRWDDDWEKLESGVYQSPFGGKNNYSIIISSTNNDAVNNLGDELSEEIKLFNVSELSKVKSTFCAKLGKLNNVNTFIEECFTPFKSKLNEIKEYQDNPSIRVEFLEIYNEIEKFNEKVVLFDNAKDKLDGIGVCVFNYRSVNKKLAELEGACRQLNKDISINMSDIKSLKEKIDKDRHEIVKDKKRIGTLDHELGNFKIRQEEIDNMRKIPILGKIYSIFIKKEITQLELKSRSTKKELEGYKDSVTFLSELITKNKNEINGIKQKVTKLESSYKKNESDIEVINGYLSKYTELENLIYNYNIDLDVNESRFKVCNCEILRIKRSRLFQLALLINESYILKNRKQVLENLNTIHKNSKAKLFSKCYRSTYTYSKTVEKNLKALWEVFCLCFPVITTTLHSLERNKIHMVNGLFDLLLIDEAGQVMPHYLVGPLYRSRRAIIVGDILQLEPVRKQLYPQVFEKYEEKYELKDIYNLDVYSAQSFANIATDYYELLDHQKIGILLEEHRRCEKNIAMFSNNHVYHNRMKIVKNNKEKEFFGTNLTFIDVKGLNNNYTNNAEVNICKAIVSELQTIDSNSQIGIITPYKKQKILLSNHIKNPNVQCGTVYGFQGRGKDIIIISLVVSSIRDKRGLNFIGAEPNFLNVALTRAKSQLIIVGNYDILSGSNYLLKLKETLKSYGKVYSFFNGTLQMDMKVYQQMKKIMSYSLTKNEEYRRIFGNFEAVNGLLSNDAHYRLLNSLFKTAESIEVCSPWITRVVAKDNFIENIEKYVKKGKKYKVFFGNKKSTYNLSSREEIKKIVEKDSRYATTDPKIDDEVEMIMSIQRAIGKDLVYKPPMHIKVLIINNRYLVIGSHNWLCKNGLGYNSPDELSCIVEDESMIAYIRNEVMK
ncbi:MAG: AAA domain-containing protein [Maledivibacter sp.]|jgi:predicted  nucleic acid-binding Zn-ribbon protein|nr:AAA domain-containing protein [Maledivibacter sp.]